MTNQYIPNIEGIRRINVDESIAFAHPFAGPNDYRSVAKEILDNKIEKMSLPNGEKTSHLLHAVYCGPEKFQNEPEAVELRDKIMKKEYHLLIFQRNLWVPEKYRSAHGVFVVYDENGVGTSEELDIGDLEKALKGGRELKNGIKFSEDGKIGFAPRNTYKDGTFENPEDFAKDGFIIVSNGEQGARNLAEVSQSGHFRYKQPRSWILDPESKIVDKDKPAQTLSVVGVNFFVDFRLLGFDGIAYDGDRHNFASGLLAA